MRIAILGSRGIPARHGGFETFAAELSARLAAAGHAVTVYCEGPAAGQPRSLGGARLEYVNCRLPGPLRTLGYDAQSLLHASRSHDVVYMLGYGAALFCVLPRLFGAETWINMDGLEWKRAKWGLLARTWLKAMEAVALRVADLVVFDADEVRREVLGRRAADPRHAVIAYGAPVVSEAPDADQLAQFGLRDRGYHLVVCRLEPENHVLEIVRGLERSGSQLPVVIVADHRCGTTYAARCVAAASGRVKFLGTVFDPAQLRALRAGCCSYLHGHSVGGTNPSLIEAMACGNPTVAHDNPFNREVLGAGGHYFADERELGLALVAYEELGAVPRLALAAQLRSRVSEHYTWERITGLYLEQLDAAERRRRTRSSEEVLACESRSEPS